ncbi:hypothetical protein I79_004196 [Cricetulus griseus]|uniref:Uncharacterized protein n=1 Tax=Cricetulus griseus TaxID=10029 RepID=G3H1Z7_CRIGR|nr:hypothetical protein I79_004196 [Cricetulus griseus]
MECWREHNQNQLQFLLRVSRSPSILSTAGGGWIEQQTSCRSHALLLFHFTKEEQEKECWEHSCTLGAQTDWELLLIMLTETALSHENISCILPVELLSSEWGCYFCR